MVKCIWCIPKVKNKIPLESFQEWIYAIVVVDSLLYNWNLYKRNDTVKIFSLEWLENFVQIIN